MLLDPAMPALARNKAASLTDLFVASCQAYGGRPALWVDGCTLTYAELYEQTARLADAIHIARGPGAFPRERQCGLLVNRTPAAYAAVLASMAAGSAYVPLNPRFPTSRLSDILVSSAIDTIIADRRSVAALQPLLEAAPRPLTVLLPDAGSADVPRLRASHRFLTKSEIEASAPAAPIAGGALSDDAYLLFTSGSTGKPKGVPISHDNVLSYIASMNERYRPRPEDKFSQLFDFSFDLSVHDMFLAWSAGACLCCAPEGSLAGLGNYIRKCELTFWLSVPAAAAYMRQMRMLRPGGYPLLRWVLFCGEALPMGLARTFQEAAPNAIVENIYGPTEATIAFTAFRLPREQGTSLDALQTVPIGWPLRGQKIMVIDAEGEPVAEGEAGELCLGGSQVAKGYWRAPELTTAKFKPPRQAGEPTMRWYRTGDRAVLSKEHGLLFLGRMDRQAKISGHRVELMEVENAMRAAAATDMVAALPWPIGEGGLALGIAGFVAGSQQSTSAITDKCRQTLPAYMVPSQIYSLDTWPLNANGKTDYKTLTTILENGNVEAR